MIVNLKDVEIIHMRKKVTLSRYAKLLENIYPYAENKENVISKIQGAESKNTNTKLR